jgi:hypothetical protein
MVMRHDLAWRRGRCRLRQPAGPRPGHRTDRRSASLSAVPQCSPILVIAEELHGF